MPPRRLWRSRHKCSRDGLSCMNLHKLLRIVATVCRFGLAALFLLTAGAKLAIIKTFAHNVAELLSAMHINYERWQWPATVAVIVAEIFAAILLLVPRTVRLGAIWSAILLIGFGAFVLYYVYVLHGEALECGCFGGIIASQLGVKTALRNLGLLVPAVIVFFGARVRGATVRKGADERQS
jgi:uncharacterized BrkB/YihY/UPF0761 family membrane protein